ncbi:Elongation factor G [Pirellulimonas nuda]|uniref:Elongation factor G n=1 Tax=Pirellulimonas nuda TaxID=2528009 RepID=A0A518D9C0_9BACT|nr:elongation factor G [Pirellulimonas nuda]QDU88065.1 Elongation factor G [Pirellulimonas nuda]
MTLTTSNIRNIAVCGHGSAGKTTLIDALLVKTGAVQGSPSVDAGSSVCDFDPEERRHKHSIEASVVHFEHAGRHFNLIDTPGYPDLIGQTIGALRGADTALVVVDAHAGVKVGTRRVWNEAGKAGLARILCITKLDDQTVDLAALMDSIHASFGDHCVLVDAPDGVGPELHKMVNVLDPTHGEHLASGLEADALHEQAVEAIIEVDDHAMEEYFEGHEPEHAELAALAVRAMQQGQATPVVCVSAKNGIGLDELLDFLAEEALPPGGVERTATIGQDTVALKADPAGPLAAQVFRTRIDPFVQKLSFIRVFSGTLKRDSVVPCPDSRKVVKIGALLRVQADKTEPIDAAVAGDIVAVAKCEELHTGASLGDAILPPIPFPTAMIGLAVSAKNRGEEAKLSTALHRLVEEDSTVHVEHDPETKQTVLTGMSELHLQLLKERVARRDHVELDTHEPKIPYRETVNGTAEGSYRHKKQTGGAGQFAEVHVRIYPFPDDAKPEEFATKERFPQLKNHHYHPENHFLWVDSVVGGTIPGNFMPAIEKGFLERLKQGVITGCPVKNVCVEVFYGKDHPVDSNENAFRTAANRVFAEVFKQASPALLEPFVHLHITAPEANVGDVSADLSGRRGQMLGMDQNGGGMTTIEAKAPLAEVTTYARTLSSMTGGQGSYTMELSGYEQAPGNVQQEVMSRATLRVEED